MIEIPAADGAGYRTFKWVEGKPDLFDAILEFWPACEYYHTGYAEVHYYAGGPSSSYWIVPNTDPRS